jgi:hypothetical protein
MSRITNYKVRRGRDGKYHSDVTDIVGSIIPGLSMLIVPSPCFDRILEGHKHVIRRKINRKLRNRLKRNER